MSYLSRAVLRIMMGKGAWDLDPDYIIIDKADIPVTDLPLYAGWPYLYPDFQRLINETV